MSVHMQGFVLQKLYHNGEVNEKGIYGNYDGKEAQIVAVKDGKRQTASLSNRDIASLLSLRASPHSLVERLEHDLGRGHHRRRHRHTHRRRRSRSHHRHRHTRRKKKHTQRHHRHHHRRHHLKKTHRRRKHRTRRR